MDPLPGYIERGGDKTDPDPLLYAWAIAIVNEQIFWLHLRDPHYDFTHPATNHKHRLIYNEIVRYNPYFACTQGMPEQVVRYLNEYSDLASAFERRVAHAKQLRPYIVQRLSLPEEEEEGPIVFDTEELDELSDCLFLHERRQDMVQLFVRGASALHLLTYPASRDEPRETRDAQYTQFFLTPPFTNRAGLLTLIAAYLWTFALPQYLSLHLVRDSAYRSEADAKIGLFAGLSNHAAWRNQYGHECSLGGYFLHFYRSVGEASRFLGGEAYRQYVLHQLGEEEYPKTRLLTLDFGAPGRLLILSAHTLSRYRQNTRLWLATNVAREQLDFDGDAEARSEAQRRVEAVKSEIFDQKSLCQWEVREETAFIAVTTQIVVTQFKAQCYNCLNVPMFIEERVGGRLFCEADCQAQYYMARDKRLV